MVFSDEGGGQIIFGGVVISLPPTATDLEVAMSRSAALGRFYIDFTVTDTPTGNPRFLLGDAHFISSNIWGGAPVYPVVVDWGVFEKNMEAMTASIQLAANAYAVNANGTTRLTIIEWFRRLKLADTAATIYQWNEESTTQTAIWTGYISGVENGLTVNGVPSVELVLSGEDRDFQMAAASDLVTKAAFPPAPDSAIGKIVPLTYGQVYNRLHANTVRNSVGFVGHPIMGAPGVVLDEQQSGLKLNVRFNKHDGTSAGHTFTENSTLDSSSEGDIWIYDQTNDAYGLVDTSSTSITNDTTKLDVLVDVAPLAMFYVRPKAIGATSSSGFSTTMYKLIDSDRQNFVTSDNSGNHIWSFECPEIVVPGNMVALHVLVDWKNGHATKNREISFGLWDGYKSGSPGYLNGVSSIPAPRIPASDRTLNICRYTELQFTGHQGTNTMSEFRAGSFITRSTSDAAIAKLELRVEVNGLVAPNDGKDGVDVYHVMMVAEMRYPLVPVEFDERQVRRTVQKRKDGTFFLQDPRLHTVSRPAESKVEQNIPLFVTGGFQKDDGSGTYTGGASTVIFRPCDIANHLIHKRYGKGRNASAGTLGNFVDARTGIMANMTAVETFGPDEVKRGESLVRLRQNWPMDIFVNNNSYQCIPDDMNPHSSTFYRSSSDIVTIGKNDIEAGSLQWSVTSPEEIVNSINLLYAHGYPDREAGRTTTYENKLSQKYFTKKTTEKVEAPFIPHQQHDGAVENGAVAYAEWLGRRTAMPLILPRFKTTQKIFDLERGHVFQFDDDLMEIGLMPPKFRGGLSYYYFNQTAATTDLSDSSSFALIATGVSTKLYIGLPQQTSHVTFGISVAATYTSASNAWKYSAGSGTYGNFTDALTTNKDGLKSTGTQTISWVKPAPHLWVKEEKTFGAFGVAGPCYWVVMDYSGGGTAGTANARVSYTPGWEGILFRARRASRVPSGQGRYMGCAVSAREVY